MSLLLLSEAQSNLERALILHGEDHLSSGRNLILAGHDHSDIERDLVLAGKSESSRDLILHGRILEDIERDLIAAGHTHAQIDRDLILKGILNIGASLILEGKTPAERAIILKGEAHALVNRYLILRGKSAAETDRDFILKGKEGLGRDLIISPRPMQEASLILRAVEYLRAAKTKRLMLLDTLNLRTTAVYRNPRDISTMKIVYGDLSAGRIPCTPLDRDGYVHHASDRPMQSIGRVYVDGEPANYGYRALPAWQDETGRGVAVVIFDNPQYDKKVSVSGKGTMKLTTGELIENPADMIYDVLVNVQGYDVSSIDAAEISRFYADCLAEGIRVADILDDASRTIKAWLDDLAINIHSHWMISDGKSVMRLRWT
jgi:hypothetical protein